MYEELVKRLRSVVDGGRDDKCDGCPSEEDYPCCVDCLEKMHKQAADAIEKMSALLDEANHNNDLAEEEAERLEAQIPRWISVEDRLPEPNKKALLFIEGNCHLGYALNDGRFRVLSLSYPSRPTHWMPLPELPEPPKEG